LSFRPGQNRAARPPGRRIRGVASGARLSVRHTLITNEQDLGLRVTLGRTRTSKHRDRPAIGHAERDPRFWLRDDVRHPHCYAHSCGPNRDGDLNQSGDAFGYARANPTESAKSADRPRQGARSGAAESNEIQGEHLRRLDVLHTKSERFQLWLHQRRQQLNANILGHDRR
jgi:hypothetical protein